MQVITVGCENCGASIKVDDESKTVVCEYCGTHLLLKKRESEPSQNQAPQNPFLDILNGVQIPQFYTKIAKHTKTIWTAASIIIAAVIILSVIIPIISVAGCSPKNKNVTYENYLKIENGMTYKQVCDIFKQDGELQYSSGDYAMYQWTRDSGMLSMAIVQVTFKDGKVTSKMQMGLQGLF